MSGMGWLFSTYIEAIQKAYGMGKGEAYIFAGKRTKGFVDSCPIKDTTAYTVVGYMETFAKEGALEFGDMLRGDVNPAALSIERVEK